MAIFLVVVVNKIRVGLPMHLSYANRLIENWVKPYGFTQLLVARVKLLLFLLAKGRNDRIRLDNRIDISIANMVGERVGALCTLLARKEPHAKKISWLVTKILDRRPGGQTTSELCKSTSS